MLKIRLQRRGKRNYATYRVVIAEDKAPIKGRFIDDLGHYNPHTDDFKVDKDLVAQWLAKGVRPSATVHNLLVTHKLLKEDKVTSWRPKQKEGAKTEAAAPAAPKAETPAIADKPAEVPAEKTEEKEATDPPAQKEEPKA